MRCKITLYQKFAKQSELEWPNGLQRYARHTDGRGFEPWISSLSMIYKCLNWKGPGAMLTSAGVAPEVNLVWSEDHTSKKACKGSTQDRGHEKLNAKESQNDSSHEISTGLFVKKHTNCLSHSLLFNVWFLARHRTDYSYLCIRKKKTKHVGLLHVVNV